MIPKVVIFDLDGTLAASKQPLTSEMAALVGALLARTRVAVMSGGALPQFLTQVVTQLPSDATLRNLYLLPTSGAALYEYVGHEWRDVYQEKLSEGDAAVISGAMKEAMRETGVVDLTAPSYGERIEYRGSEVTLSALGQKAPIEEKEKWDPDKVKRLALEAAIAAKLPGFDVKMGGSTSIDVTRAGVDKAYGVRKLAEHLSIPVTDMLYVGDQLTQGGNDEVVVATSIPTRSVANPSQTATLIEELLRQ